MVSAGYRSDFRVALYWLDSNYKNYQHFDDVIDKVDNPDNPMWSSISSRSSTEEFNSHSHILMFFMPIICVISGNSRFDA
jgi:hypothetical protein